MSALIFLSLCLVFAVAAYPILRSVARSRMHYGELVNRVVPLSDQARAVLSSDPMPATWLQVSDLMRVRHNSALFTSLADRYRRVMAACTDLESCRQMDLTYRTFLRNHWELTLALMAAIVNFCLGKIAKERCSVYMATVASKYTNEVILIEEMSEVMDHTCVAVLEGHFGT